MAVAEGRKGKITVVASATGPHTVAEMGEWSISGQSRNMIDYTAFGDETAKYKPGMLDPGTVSFNGFFDGTDTTGQVKLVTALSSGGFIGTSSGTGSAGIRKLRLWANDDTSFDSYGFFSCTGTTGAGFYVQSIETGTNKDGLCTFNVSLKASAGVPKWCTSTS